LAAAPAYAQGSATTSLSGTVVDPTANPGSGATIFQVGSAYQDTSNTFDPGGRLGQIVWRINW
jgi:hypothetical protein